MTIVVKSNTVGTFNWEVPENVEKCFEDMVSAGKELGLSEEDTNKAQQEVVEYFQNSIYPLLCLLSSSVLSGPLFSLQAEVVSGGIKRMTLEIGDNLHEFHESDPRSFRD